MNRGLAQSEDFSPIAPVDFNPGAPSCRLSEAGALAEALEESLYRCAAADERPVQRVDRSMEARLLRHPGPGYGWLALRGDDPAVPAGDGDQCGGGRP